MAEIGRQEQTAEIGKAEMDGREMGGGKMDDREMEIEEYDAAEAEELEQYIADTFGEFQEVFHEITSPDIHVDIAIVEPAQGKEYFKLVTMGMGAHSMNVPKELEQYRLERAELVIFLPKDWKIKERDEKWYWPMRWLKMIARMPGQMGTWVGYGHSISNHGKPLAENNGFTGIGLVNACRPLEMSGGKKVNFYLLLPLFEEELVYKKECKNMDALLRLFEQEQITPIVDITRKNSCR